MADVTKTHCDDPDRCQAMTQIGQCTNLSAETSDYCALHGANRAAKRDFKNYSLGMWRAKMNAKLENPEFKSLREEVGLIRMLVDSRFTKIKNDTDLMLESQAIADLMMKAERLVMSCNKLEASTGQLMDKQAILVYASKLIGYIDETITHFVTDKELAKKIVSALGDKIIEAAANNESE